MKVVAFNGSARKDGNTAGCINTVFGELEKEGIDCEMIMVGKKRVHGCVACHTCAKKQNQRCAFDDDPVNDWIQKIRAADGIILGSPVHFAGVAGAMKAFLDRAFFVSTTNGNLYRHKVDTALAAVRRSGGISRGRGD